MPYSYDSLTEVLAHAGIEEARDEAAALLAHFAGASRAALLCDRHRIYHAPGLDDGVKKRLSRYPLQYILGSWDFYGLTFRVNSHCLIPRPDTEILVEEAVQLIPQGVHVVDLCTGSGCIAVALLHARPDLTCAALELYPETLALACENAASCGVGARFLPVQADLLQDGLEKLKAVIPPGGLGAILSNPPYIRRSALSALAPELAFEPQAALDGGEDGLIFYEAILTRYRTLLVHDGWLLLEIGYDQAEDVRRLALQAGGWTEPRVVRDLGGRDRVLILRRTL